MNTQKAQKLEPQPVTELDAGECELIGDREYIPAGEYQATYSHYETAGVFSTGIRGDKKTRRGGKVYLWFNIDPYKVDERLDPRDNIKLYVAYNAASIDKPFGKNGKFKMTRGKRFVTDYEELFGSVKRRDRISPNNYKGKLLKVNVKDVTSDQYQNKRSDDLFYSVIDKVLTVEAGI